MQGKYQPTVKRLSFDEYLEKAKNMTKTEKTIDLEAENRKKTYELEKRLRDIRQKRRKYAENARTMLIRVIPPVFFKARLKDFSGAFKEKLLSRKKHQGLYLWGTTGTGKSHAMAALARFYITKGYSFARTTFEKMCLELRDTYKKDNSSSELDVFDCYTRPDFLIIEDLGTTRRIDGQESEFNLRTLYLILDERLEQNKPTFITSNKSIESITESFDERIGSRLKTFLTIELSGRDKREFLRL